MKPLKAVSFLIAPIFFAGALAAKPVAGPKGGRILTTQAPHAEFFVEKDRKVTITFYDTALELLPPAEQVVSAIAEAKSGNVILDFTRTSTHFVSKQPIPPGDGYRIVVQIRERAGAMPVNYRVDFQVETCGGCKRARYACTCEGSENQKKTEQKESPRNTQNTRK